MKKHIIIIGLILNIIYISSCQKQTDCYRYDFIGEKVTMSDLFKSELDSADIKVYVSYHRHILGDNPKVIFTGIEHCPN